MRIQKAVTALHISEGSPSGSSIAYYAKVPAIRGANAARALALAFLTGLMLWLAFAAALFVSLG